MRPEQGFMQLEVSTGILFTHFVGQRGSCICSCQHITVGKVFMLSNLVGEPQVGGQTSTFCQNSSDIFSCRTVEKWFINLAFSHILVEFKVGVSCLDLFYVI